MNKIKPFYLFEGYSFPESIIPLNNWIEDFVVSKFRWWISRKKFNSYSEDFVFYPEDMNIPYNQDFPMSRFKLKLIFEITPDKWSGSGYAYAFKSPGQVDADCSQSQYNRGKIVPSMEIHLSSNKEVIEVGEMIQYIKVTMRHELLHLYQFYKKKKRGIDCYPGSIGEALIGTLNYIGPGKLNELLFLAYFMMIKDEFFASLSEYTLDIPNSEREISEEQCYKILNTPKDKYLQEIEDDLEYPEIIPKIFLKSYIKTCPPKFLNRSIINKCIDYETFINFIYDETKKNLPHWLKKINKIKFSKNI